VIDAVVISHDHYDHLGKATVRQLSQLSALAETQWVTPLGVGKLLRDFGVAAARVKELDWTQQRQSRGRLHGDVSSSASFLGPELVQPL